uniref:Uncharacterized protein n=1 Tax=viral metagenome TaxID=1070528 RepID=A0A6C0HC41_9ZZZZ
MSSSNKSNVVQAIPLIEASVISNPEKVGRTIVGGLSLHKPSIFKLGFLITYAIVVCYFLVNDPGKFVSKYPSIFNFIALLSGVFLFYNAAKSNADFIDFRFSTFKIFIILLCVFVLSISFYRYNPGGYIMEYLSTPIYGLIVASFVFFTLYFLLTIYFSYSSKNQIVKPDTETYLKYMSDINKLFTVMKYSSISVVTGFFIIILAMFGAQITANISSNNYGKAFLNIIIIIVIAAIVFRALTYSNFYQNSPLTQLIVNFIFYIPCLLVAFIDNFVKLSGLDSKSAKDSGLFKPTPTDYILLVIAILLNVGYFAYPYAADKFSKQGGVMLIDNPIYTNSENILASYQSLNKFDIYDLNYDASFNTDFNYTYAISFWVYIDAASPSMSSAYNTYTSLLNYGGKPNVLYKGADNTLMITMDSTSAPKTKYTPKTPPFEVDDNGNRIIYVKKDILLQKWNNIIINYNGGTLDIFYNGELVKSSIEVLSWMSYDTLSVGTKNGIHGGICNLIYFNKSLNIQQINNLYNSVKDNTPPVYKSSEETIKHIAEDVPSTMNNPVSSIRNYTNTLGDKFKNK